MPHARLLSLILIGLAGSASVGAAPAPWYWWHSRLDGRPHCAQSSPGTGWTKGMGPYRDLKCEQPVGKRVRVPPPRFEPGQPDRRSGSEVRTDHLESN